MLEPEQMAVGRSGEDQRRAPRTLVDVEAELHLHGHPVCHGIMQDLSILGSLFMPEKALRAEPNAQGRLRFAMPTAVSWIEPRIQVRRVSSFPRATGEEVQTIGFEFSGLDSQQERAIAAGCMEWPTHRVRDYSLAARCFVQGMGAQRHFSRFGRVVGGTRNHIRLSLASSGELARQSEVRVKVTATSVAGEIEDVRQERSGVEVLVRLTGWGRDFFLHEARRESLADTSAARFPM